MVKNSLPANIFGIPFNQKFQVFVRKIKVCVGCDAAKLDSSHTSTQELGANSWVKMKIPEIPPWAVQDCPSFSHP